MASRLAVGEIQPFQLVSLRWLLVAWALWLLFGHEVRAHWRLLRPRLGWLILTATLGFTTFNALLYLAGHSTGAINIGILQGSIPVMVLVGAFIAHRTKVTALQVAGVIVTLAGVAVIASKGDPRALMEIGMAPGDGLMLAAGVCYSFYTVMLGARPAIPGRVFFTAMAVVALATSIPFAVGEALLADIAHPPTGKGWLIALYVAIFPSCLAQLFFLRSVDLIGPGRAGLYINLVPVFAPILAILFLGEVFAWHHAAALGLVLGGIALAERGKA